MEKEQLIGKIIGLLDSNFGSASKNDLQFLRSRSTDWLQDKLQELQEQVQIAKSDQTEQPNQAEQTRIAKVELDLVQHGVAKQDLEKIHSRLPGVSFTVQNVRSLIQTDPAFKASRTGEPFAELIRAEQQQSSLHRAARRVFDTAANTLTGQGIVNVASNDANFGLTQQAIKKAGLEFNLDNVTNVLVNGGLRLAPNDSEKVQALSKQTRSEIISTIDSYLDRGPESHKIRQWVLDTSNPLADIRERVEAAKELADGYGPHPHINAQYFRRLIGSVTPTQDLRQRVEQAQQRQNLRGMTTAQLREHINKNPELKFHQPQQSTPVLPAEITAERIKRASVEEHQNWNRVYGSAALDARLQGTA